MLKIRTAAVGGLAAAVLGGIITAPAASAADGDATPDVTDLADMVDAASDAYDRSNIGVRENEEQAPSTHSHSADEVGASSEDCLTATGDEELPILRFSGPNRYETATCVSFWTWPDHDDETVPTEEKAQVVVLARGDNFPDALAGGPLAAYYEGPLLLTQPDSLPGAVMSEIERVLAPGGRVYLIGGNTSVSNDIRDELQGEGFDSKRLAGSNRYETAIKIAEELPDTSNFFFATGEKFPDALAAGNAAGFVSFVAKYTDEIRPMAVLLTQGDELGDDTFNFVVDRGEQFEQWALATAGGDADRAAAAAFGSENLGARYSGSNRFDTAAQISEAVFTDDNGELYGFGTGLATGLKFPDALSATASLARWGQPLLLTLSDHPSDETVEFLEDHAGEPVDGSLDLFGGTSTISDEVANIAGQAYR